MHDDEKNRIIAQLRQMGKTKMNDIAIRRLAETYRPNISDLADRLAKGPLHDMFFPKPVGAMSEEFAASMAQDAIRKAMRK